jgi:hypothetical protein
MHKLDPNDMDALFRDGADKHEFSYNPNSWAMMEEKLDSKDRRKYFYWFFLGVIFIAGISGVYLFMNSSENSIALDEQSKSEIVENVNKDTKATIKEGIKNVRSKEVIESESTKNIENYKEINNIDQDNIPTLKEENINTVSKVRSSNIGAQNSFQSENTGSLVDNKVVSILSPTESSTSNNSSSIILGEDNIKKENTSTVSSIPTNEKPRELFQIDKLSNANNNVLLSLHNEEIDFNLNTKQYTLPITAASSSRYVITAYGSSDYSTIGFFKDPQSGFTLGGKVGIQLARKFQFDIGFAYSLKKYGSQGTDYKIEGGWDTMVGIDPTWMDGKGNVLQIPIEASYYFNGYEKNSFFVNAGISSFLFNSEWYGFKYDEVELLNNPNATPIDEITMDEISKRNFHPAGIGRISIGYQKILSPKMAFELSPYLQIPLTGIGEGKVDLYTAGLQFALKFNTK